MFGAGLLVLFALLAVFAGQVSPYDPIHQDFRIEREAPSPTHLMGTDEFGRDVFSRVVWGARVSLQAGAVAASIALVAGLFLGMIAAYYRGRTDALVMRLMDVLLAFPYLLLAIGIVAILGPGLLTAMIAIGIVYIPNYARVVRGAVLSVGARDFVQSARAIVAPDRVSRAAAAPRTLSSRGRGGLVGRGRGLAPRQAAAGLRPAPQTR